MRSEVFTALNVRILRHRAYLSVVKSVSDNVSPPFSCLVECLPGVLNKHLRALDKGYCFSMCWAGLVIPHRRKPACHRMLQRASLVFVIQESVLSGISEQLQIRVGQVPKENRDVKTVLSLSFFF